MLVKFQVFLTKAAIVSDLPTQRSYNNENPWLQHFKR